MDDDQQFCLRWNNHQSTLVSVFDTLLEKGIHVDCTLAAEGQTLKAHKVVLSACSPYFENVLSQQYDKHPIIILKDVKYAELRAMMDYMYRGEVNISQDQLAALLKAAESLQIKGLSDNKPSRPPSRPAQAAPAHPPRAPSPPPQGRSSSSERRGGSLSPSRRRKVARRSLDAEPTSEPPPSEEAPPSRDTVEDLTIDEDPDQTPQHNDVVRNFQWHMERSQDELMNSNDSIRESQELHKELPSALLSLLSARQPAALAPSRLQLAAALHAPAALDALAAVPDTMKPLLLQHAFLQNNNTLALADYKPKRDDHDSDAEYDDTDDIVLPDETETMYESVGVGLGAGAGAGGALDPYETLDAKAEGKGYGKREGSGSDEASRQFECRHCGKKYRWKSTLRRHENVECGGKAPAHQCPYCSYRAKQRGNLGVHIRKHHHDEWYAFASNKVRRNKKTSSSV
ncbi:longitudinals lacking protein isoform X1 [Papilio machaon]|uniref:longitudinals lacking protein isoform X1 n=1 Tax=Papilio machaon TaxID=76193 RepID=UPI001E665787|nr:longitudinals lacking protein isoform X1 [Papilio machaon]XP_045536277.1 longitudinals lacking protein isoform X1 [Papilio machaon]